MCLSAVDAVQDVSAPFPTHSVLVCMSIQTLRQIIYIWKFPKMGVPQIILFLMGFSIINHPFGDILFMEPPIF